MDCILSQSPPPYPRDRTPNPRFELRPNGLMFVRSLDQYLARGKWYMSVCNSPLHFSLLVQIVMLTGIFLAFSGHAPRLLANRE